MTARATRKTEQKQTIRTILQGAERPLSAQEIVDIAEQQGVAVGLATVYRNVKRLCEDGWLSSIDFAGEPSRYERKDHHHHHFRCEDCGKVFDVDGCGSTLSNNLERHAPPGFVVRAHEVWLHGTCADCVEA